MFLKNHLFKVAHWIVKIQALESHLLSSCILELHNVLEKTFASLFILNCENSSCSWIFILPNVFEKSLTCFWFMNFHFAWVFEKSLTCLSHELWFCVMLLKNHSFAWIILIHAFENPFNCLVHNFEFWMVLLRITLTWLLMLNIENAIFLKIMSQLGLWILGGFQGAFENHFAYVWINFLERISWSWESWVINLLKTNYYSFWLREFCENKIMFLKFTWFACELILWKCNSLENWNPFYFTRFINFLNNFF